MKNIKAPHRYAKAVLNLGLEKDLADVIDANMKLIAETIDENIELRAVLESPVIKSDLKLAVLKDLFESKVNAICVGLFNVLVENKRLPLLRDIAAQYNVLYNHFKAVDRAIVTTAVPLSADLETKVLAKVKELTGKEAAIENVVDSSIIGGFILRIGDLQYDASISNQLNSLRQAFDTSAFEKKI
ncbi:MAG: ATP synthase F1 subunit delta [Flavobacteriaceae bacterium]